MKTIEEHKERFARHNARSLEILQLKRMGFDKSHRTERGGGITLKCSQCEAMCVNGTPLHEAGCPHDRHECAGCNEIITANQKYCRDCQ